MRVVIVGGGKVGSYLAQQLLDTGNAVVVAESNAKRARELAESLDALVIEGDGTDIEVLRSAHIERSDWLLAVTGLDEVNLVACQLGATLGAHRSLARLNDPRNRHTFSALGVQVVAVTDLIGEVIERELDTRRLERVTLLGRGNLSLIEVDLPPTVPPRRVVDLGLPPSTLLVAVISEGSVVVPGANTVINPEDRVVAITTLDREPAVRDVLCRVES